MKTKLLTGLAFAAALLIGGPAFAHDNHGGGRGGGGRGHAVAAVHRGGGGHAVAARHFNAPKVASYGRSRGYARMATDVHPRNAVNLTMRNSANFNRAADRNAFRSNANREGLNRNSFAFGGSTYDHGNGSNRGGYGGHGQYAFSYHQGWDHGQRYYWNGHHYGWYNNGWYIIDAFPGYYGYNYGPGYYDNGYTGGGVGTQVQAALSQQGYYQGPVDGVVGPGTRAAIAAFQRDNGLAVTGTITPGLLNTLGIG